MELYNGHGTLWNYTNFSFCWNLRLVDRIRSVDYAEDSLKWTTDNAEETDSQSDSCSDSD